MDPTITHKRRVENIKTRLVIFNRTVRGRDSSGFKEHIRDAIKAFKKDDLKEAEDMLRNSTYLTRKPKEMYISAVLAAKTALLEATPTLPCYQYAIFSLVTAAGSMEKFPGHADKTRALYKMLAIVREKFKEEQKK